MPSNLTDLPPEILLCIGQYLSSRLGLPTGALNRHIVEILGAPDSIAVRAFAHYRSCANTLVREASRTESGQAQYLVVEAICKLLSRVPGFDVNAIAKSPNWLEGSTALLAAAEVGSAGVVKCLLAWGARLDENRNSRRPLVRAAERGHLEVVRLILERDEYIRINIGFVLYICSYAGHAHIARYLLAQTAYADLFDFDICLDAAVARDHVGVVSLLVDHGADFHKDGEASLWYAVKNGSVQTVEFLLERGADSDAPSRHRTEALAEAKKEWHHEVLDMVGEYCETSECED